MPTSLAFTFIRVCVPLMILATIFSLIRSFLISDFAEKFSREPKTETAALANPLSNILPIKTTEMLSSIKTPRQLYDSDFS